MDTAEFKRIGHELVDWIAKYYETIESYSVQSRLRPGDIRRRIPVVPPAAGEPMSRILEDFKEIIMPGITHWQHPCWFAYFPANTSPPSILAELLTAGIGTQCMIWQTSPAAEELEDVVLDWLKQMLGLPKSMTGVIHDTASVATLCALITARERATGFSSNERGLSEDLVVYTSEEAHSSVEKGAKIAGYGRENVRRVPTDESFAMIPEKLAEYIDEDKQNGRIPACAIATVGTTSSTAVDPLRLIGSICAERDVWLHVDGAYAGAAAMLDEKRWILDGMDLADSFVFNPHKWMLTNFDCSAYFVKDAGLLTRTFEIHPEYLKTGVDDQVKNYRDWGIQLGRRFRALKLWFVIRCYGVEGLKEIIREHIRLASLFKSWVLEHEHFEIMAPQNFGVVCFRLNDGRREEDLNRLNKLFHKKLNEKEEIYLTHTSLKSRYVLRMSIGSRLTEERHVKLAWELIKKTAVSFTL
jgi:aromatic-L-amino-acid decarboxylase